MSLLKYLGPLTLPGQCVPKDRGNPNVLCGARGPGLGSPVITVDVEIRSKPGTSNIGPFRSASSKGWIQEAIEDVDIDTDRCTLAAATKTAAPDPVLAASDWKEWQRPRRYCWRHWRTCASVLLRIASSVMMNGQWDRAALQWSASTQRPIT